MFLFLCSFPPDLIDHVNLMTQTDTQIIILKPEYRGKKYS